MVWERLLADFSLTSYTEAVEKAFSTWETETHQRLAPREKRRVGLKIYTNSGFGLATPHSLTLAVIQALETRGYRRDEMVIFDLNENSLRASGYLPPLSEGGDHFAGVPVRALRSGDFYDALWFYDNPLPPHRRTLSAVPEGVLSHNSEGEDRKSYLPVPLLQTFDFWINLPAVIDLPALGVSGALANVTLWNASNTRRFMSSPANAPVAVSEMASVPELKSGLAFTLMSLERYQFIGGTAFNSLYSVSEPLLWMSSNPVALDYRMLEKMNERRSETELPLIEPRPLMFDYAKTIGLGEWEPNKITIRRF